MKDIAVSGPPIGISLIGSTGSIGRQTLEVVAQFPDRFRVVALAAGRNKRLLLEQAAAFRPDLVVTGESSADCAGATGSAQLAWGSDGLVAAATYPSAQIVVVASSGHIAIRPTIEAIKAGKTIALASKEVIVCAGELIMPLAEQHGVEIRPVDSEHSAIWQCLAAADRSLVSRLILTASGGPFLNSPLAELERVTASDALHHPTWKMGKKISVDSATMVNKGLELIEARWLFGVPPGQIDAVIHPQSIVHSIVEFVDGSQIAQLSWPDMRLPIQLALTYPNRIESSYRRLDLPEAGVLSFSPLDPERYPGFQLARTAAVQGQSYPTVLSAADELAVEAFLGGAIGYLDIVRVIEATLTRHDSIPIDSLDAVFEADRVGRLLAADQIKAITNRGQS